MGRIHHVRWRCAGVLASCCFLLALASAAPAWAQTVPTFNMFGSVGLVDMPSARMADDGQLSVGASFMRNTQHYNLGFQALPWLETSFRYSGLQHFDPAYPVYYDRSFAVKLRLFNEGDYMPAIAVGINDLVGTGVYGGEYLVASKAVGDIDVTLGMGWGRQGSTALFRNPLTYISKSFETRPGFPSAAGSFGTSTFFHGPSVGLFGGVTWKTPLDGLSVSAEYSSDRYTLETSRGNFRPRSQMNFGAAYQLNENASLGLNWLYGDSIGGRFTVTMDPFNDAGSQRLGPPPVQPIIRSDEEQRSGLEALRSGRSSPVRPPAATTSSAALVDALWQRNDQISDVAVIGNTLSIRVVGVNPATTCSTAADLSRRFVLGITTVNVSDGRQSVRCATGGAEPAPAVAGSPSFATMSELTVIDARGARPVSPAALAKLKGDIAGQNLLVLSADINGAVATIYYANQNYMAEKDALERLLRIFMAEAPPNVEEVRFVVVENSVPQRQFVFLRTPQERNFYAVGTVSLEQGVSSPAPMTRQDTGNVKGRQRFTWVIGPALHQQLFDPTNPFGVQIAVGASAAYELLPGLQLHGSGEISLWDNFNTARLSDSVLPHVRTDFVRYFSEGKNGISSLALDYRFRLSPNVFAVTKIGYLEDMFAGAGGEILWRPEGQRWALGFDAYEVQQRNFNRLLGLQNYHVFTGHVSLYYASPWYNLNFVLSAGQYLAGDRGITFEATRRFASGVEVGTFFTKTNVSAARFGEGSFDKGIILRFPLGWVIPINSQLEYGTIIRPVQRDGGQRLGGDATLYEETRRSSEAEMALTGLSMPGMW